MDEKLADRLQRLEDIEAIRSLKHRYQDAVDTNWRAGPPRNLDELTESLFTEDVEFVAPVGEGMVVTRGMAAMKAFMEAHHRRTSFALHFVTNGIINVDGDIAEGQWTVLVAVGEGEDAGWFSARYLENYRRTPGGWRIARSEQVIALRTPYGTPWRPSEFQPKSGLR